MVNANDILLPHTADDILVPHSPEVLAAKQQKRLDEFEVRWPGVIDRTKKWMRGKGYMKQKGLHPETYTWCAPLIVLNTIEDFIGESIAHTEEDDMLVDVAEFLWRMRENC